MGPLGVPSEVILEKIDPISDMFFGLILVVLIRILQSTLNFESFIGN